MCKTLSHMVFFFLVRYNSVRVGGGYTYFVDDDQGSDADGPPCDKHNGSIRASEAGHSPDRQRVLSHDPSDVASPRGQQRVKATVASIEHKDLVSPRALHRLKVVITSSDQNEVVSPRGSGHRGKLTVPPDQNQNDVVSPRGRKSDGQHRIKSMAASSDRNDKTSPRSGRQEVKSKASAQEQEENGLKRWTGKVSASPIAHESCANSMSSQEQQQNKGSEAPLRPTDITKLLRANSLSARREYQNGVEMERSLDLAQIPFVNRSRYRG
jgi:hypothetical protein